MDIKECKEVEVKLHERNIVKHGLNLNPVVSLAGASLLIIFSLYALF